MQIINRPAPLPNQRPTIIVLNSKMRQNWRQQYISIAILHLLYVARRVASVLRSFGSVEARKPLSGPHLVLSNQTMPLAVYCEL